ncbi:aliphatic sulfonate ABC transporter substrate-binding protein [Oceanobacillus piezotolerans]|nr:aliphatic sulfonate ABC transporter substrate-binding protein [Oceanobacillus piezotolerans]
MRLKKWSALLLFILIATLVAACGNAKSTGTAGSESASDAESEQDLPEVLNIGYFEYIDDSLIVKQQGWLEEELNQLGVEVNWISFQTGRDANNALLSKAIDIQIGIGDPPVSIAVESKTPYEIFWAGQTVGEAEALVTKKDSGIDRIEDLKGKRVATTIASTSHYSLLSALQLNGLTEADVQIVDLTAPDILSAWQRGDIDAAYTWDPILTEILKDGTRLISSADLAEQRHPTGTYGVVHTEFGEKYPKIVELYIKQLIRAQQLYTENPDEAAKLWAEGLHISEEEAAKQAKGSIWLTPEQQLSKDFLGTSGNIGNTAESLKKIGDFLVDQKSLTTKLEVSSYEAIINPVYLENVVNKTNN